MKMTLSRKILIGFSACALVLLGVAIFSFQNSEKVLDSNVLVTHTHQVLHEFDEIMLASVDAETGARGFALTGNEDFLDPYSNSQARLGKHLAELKRLTSDNPVQQRNLRELEDNINLHSEYLEKLIEFRKADFQKAVDLAISGEGKRIHDEIRSVVSIAQGIENKLLEERKIASEEDIQSFNLVFITLLIIIVVVLVFVYMMINANLRALRNAEEETNMKNWLLTGNTELNNALQGEKTVNELGQDMINQLTSYLDAQIGTVYVTEEGGDELTLAGSYAVEAKKLSSTLKIGEGIAGQVALERKPVLLKDVPDGYLNINSSLGNIKPKNILVFPFLYSGKVKGVIEIGSMNDFSDTDMKLLALVSENIGIGINSAQSRVRLQELLEETQLQSEELQTQQEELRQINEELEEQAQNLRQQQEELQMTNEELEEQTQALEAKNKEVETARSDIEQKTKQLEISSKYKSEFLANMSHELRTPLNSLLILSKDLAENKQKNLDGDQVESAEIIYKSGQDLLSLINEVLDLSKIEAGKMSLNVERVSIQEFTDELLRDFRHQAEEKGLQLNSKLDNSLPQTMKTDGQRLKQILKNLLSNAIKFTEEGSVGIEMKKHSRSQLMISVTDTGIGIAEDKQLAVFEAFQQVDGSTARKYGGTGLGLSISRELAALLGGRITVESKPGEGSVFTLTMPLEIEAPAEHVQEILPLAKPRKISPASSPVEIAKYLNYPAAKDDRDILEPNDRIMLIIEDDLNFAAVLMKQANIKGFKCLSAATGEDGLKLAAEYKPHAIILDLGLPGMDGHQVLAELKANPDIRHIPVHIMSATEPTLDTMREGAIEYLMKPIDKKDLDDALLRIETFINRKMKNLLIVEDDENSRKAMRKLIGNGDVKCFDAASGEEGLNMFREMQIDCVVLDIGLPDMSGFDFIYKLEAMKGAAMPPIIIYTGRELSREEDQELQKYSDSIIIKGVKSEERLLDETALFLHRTVSNLPEPKQMIIKNLYDKEAIFFKRTILLVDDDMRNVFALSKVLREQGMEIIKADNGKNALEILDIHAEIDLVLMDIMMPEMDGYEAMRKIREQEKLKNLPIIALTAKAMKDDKQKCIDAGASDYITKPIEVERLLSLMRVWLSK